MDTNVDKNDVNLHASIKNWWDINGPMMGLHAMNQLRISMIRNGLEQAGKLNSQDTKSDPHYLSNIKVIDVGCGGGILCEPLARLGADVTGIDPSTDLIDLAKRHASDNARLLKSQPTYIASNIENHSSSNPDTYDALIASEVLEHVPNKQSFLDACIKTLKPGGSIFVTTPNRTTASWLGSIIIAENVLKLLPKGIHEWDKFATPTEVQQMLNKSDCNTVMVNGLMFNVLNRKWSWSSTTMFHYALHAIKRIR